MNPRVDVYVGALFVTVCGAIASGYIIQTAFDSTFAVVEAKNQASIIQLEQSIAHSSATASL